MINVTITDEIVEISGHAGMAEAGKDIVCAAVSALADTAASLLWDEPEAKSGYVLLRWRKMDRAEVHYIEYLTTGLRLIENAYPTYITIKDDRTE